MAGTLTVACKLPCGYVMEVWGMEERQEEILGGGFRVVKRAVSLGKRVKINGAARKIGQDSPHEIRYGVGLTHGVDADFFAAWLDQHKDDDLVKNGIIFAAAKSIDVEAQAKDRSPQRSGLEAVDPNNLPGEFRRAIEPLPKS
jgi:hypothetical protein